MYFLFAATLFHIVRDMLGHIDGLKVGGARGKLVEDIRTAGGPEYQVEEHRLLPRVKNLLMELKQAPGKDVYEAAAAAVDTDREGSVVDKVCESVFFQMPLHILVRLVEMARSWMKVGLPKEKVGKTTLKYAVWQVDVTTEALVQVVEVRGVIKMKAM